MGTTVSKFSENLLVPVLGTWAPDAARDRLSSTIFLAGLFHGIVILGVTFTGEPHVREPEPTSLDVVIVTRDYERLAPPRNPALLAQQNLIGRGNAPLDARLRTALASDPVPALPGANQDGAPVEPSKQGSLDPAEARLTAVVPEREGVRFGETGTPDTLPARRRMFRGEAEATELVAEPDTATVVPDANPREFLVSANTRESRIAGYLNSWKLKVERIGTLNFPNAAQLATLGTYPVLEVAITADGSLKEVVVRNSSGYTNLDQAAMEILRIAAPFDPFPQRLRDDYDVLRFAYEWRFGAGFSGRVTAVSGS